jgi:hypothetical protein
LRSIYEYILFAFRLFRAAVHQKELLKHLREAVFFARVVIPGSIDLTTLKDQQDPFHNSDYQFIELTFEDLNAGKLTFSVPTRQIKAMRKINRGWRGFALIVNSTVVGDMWCITPQEKNTPIRFPDLDVLGITFTDGDAYAADMYIDPSYRGKKLALPFYLSTELKLKREGWRRVYACYYENNLSAKWLHWSLKFNELPKFRESRFFFFTKACKYMPHDL